MSYLKINNNIDNINNLFLFDKQTTQIFFWI